MNPMLISWTLRVQEIESVLSRRQTEHASQRTRLASLEKDLLQHENTERDLHIKLAEAKKKQATAQHQLLELSRQRQEDAQGEHLEARRCRSLLLHRLSISAATAAALHRTTANSIEEEIRECTTFSEDLNRRKQMHISRGIEKIKRRREKVETRLEELKRTHDLSQAESRLLRARSDEEKNLKRAEEMKDMMLKREKEEKQIQEQIEEERRKRIGLEASFKKLEEIIKEKIKEIDCARKRFEEVHDCNEELKRRLPALDSDLASSKRIFRALNFRKEDEGQSSDSEEEKSAGPEQRYN